MSATGNFIINQEDQCNLNNNNNMSYNHAETSSTAIETNPTNNKMDSITLNDTSKNRNDESAALSESKERPLDTENMQSPTSNNDTTGQDDSVTDQKNDSSTFSTAFTISFEDDTNTSKKLGIKDSIRKFAPPKPHTIEKPRVKSDQNQDHSLVSIESAPAGLSKHSSRKGCSNSSRSSSRKSNSSRHSNISESAAFLIDKMLNCKPSELESSPKQRGSSSKSQQAKSPSSQGKKVQAKRLTHSSDDILDSEIDFNEDKSDNGTYIVGADPESEAARKKIDELFGVVKAAEASVIAESASRSHKTLNNKTNNRPSRLTDKKPLNRERQEHINRLACRNSSMSRSSSSSRQDNNSAADHQQRNSSRNSRNSSCDRTAPPRAKDARPKRSASQSSRQSSNKELSDGDTRSSRSSLHHDADIVSNDNSVTTNPDMKFNRAFVLRRARLGLGEPLRVTSSNHNYSQDHEQHSVAANNMSSSQRRHQINSNTYKANQQQQGSSSSGSANFCRDDGGRFSLRMKNNALPSRLSSAQTSNRPPQHNTLIDNYLNKVSSAKNCGTTNVLSAIGQQESILLQQHQRNLAKHTIQSPCTSSGVPCQSSDELETMSPSSRNRMLLKAGRPAKKGLSDLDSDSVSYNQRFNYSLNSDYEANNYSLIENRASSSVGKQHHHNHHQHHLQQQSQTGSNLQLGALDSLVISAISSLSLKIRHSVCDVLVEHAKKLPVENETRLIVEEILPQLTANPSTSKSPTSIEEIDQSLYFDLAKTLKNLKKVEQMVDVINLISNQIPSSSTGSSNATNNSSSSFKTSGHGTGIARASDSTTNSDMNSVNDLSPV